MGAATAAYVAELAEAVGVAPVAVAGVNLS